jgi:hypothetical protein
MHADGLMDWNPTGAKRDPLTAGLNEIFKSRPEYFMPSDWIQYRALEETIQTYFTDVTNYPIGGQVTRQSNGISATFIKKTATTALFVTRTAPSTLAARTVRSGSFVAMPSCASCGPASTA